MQDAAIQSEVIDASTWTPAQARETCSEVRAYMHDPCSAILFQSVDRMRWDPEARAELRRRRKAAMDAEAEARMGNLR